MKAKRRWTVLASAALVIGSVLGTSAPASAAVVYNPPRFWSTDGGAMNDNIRVTWESSSKGKIWWRLSDIRADGRAPKAVVRFYYGDGSFSVESMTWTGGYNTEYWYSRTSLTKTVRTIKLEVCNANAYCVIKSYDNPYN